MCVCVNECENMMGKYIIEGYERKKGRVCRVMRFFDAADFVVIIVFIIPLLVHAGYERFGYLCLVPCVS